MIVRKPYALFIKYFKIIHIIMALLIGILIYRTGVLLHFFNTYISDYQTATDGFATGDYVNFYSFLLVMIVIIANISILSVMFVKKKPKLLYILNIILFFGIIVFFGICYSTLFNITNVILDIRVSKAIRDISVLLIALEVISFILVLVRGTGFDFKKFDFGADLEQLKIEEKDREEVEVAFELDKNRINRQVRNKFRNIKYVYFEHRFLINTLAIIGVVVLGFITYFNISIYRANYGENAYFSASGVSLKVTDSYITNEDYNGTKITDNTLVIVRIDVKKTNLVTKRLNTGLLTLQTGFDSYGQTPDYNKKLADFGIGYVDQKLTEDYVPYIVVFEVPNDKISGKLTLKFNDNISYVRGEMGAKNIYVKLKPQKFNKSEVVTNKLKDTVNFEQSILKDASLSVNEVSIANSFKVAYDFCSTQNNCFKSYEYVTPTASGDSEKTLMRVKGEFKLAETVNISGVSNFLDFINMFGYLNYNDGENHQIKINSKNIKSDTRGDKNTYYIEVPRAVLNASKISFSFKIRNYTYNYTIN